jgi:hypothetical protein
MVREAFMSKNDANYVDKLRLFAKIMQLGSLEVKFALKGWDGGPTGFYEKRQEFADLLQTAMTGETDQRHVKFKDLWLWFRNLRPIPKRKDEVCQSPSVPPSSGFSVSSSNSFLDWTNSAYTYLKSLTGASPAQKEDTTASGSVSSGAGNGI